LGISLEMPKNWGRISLDLVRSVLLIAILLAYQSAFSAELFVDHIPVHGHTDAVAAADIQAAITAVRSENPPAKSCRIREVRVLDATTIYLVTAPILHGSEGRFEAKRMNERWHYSTTYIGPL
jgi:hypothetical protein